MSSDTNNNDDIPPVPENPKVSPPFPDTKPTGDTNDDTVQHAVDEWTKAIVREWREQTDAMSGSEKYNLWKDGIIICMNTKLDQVSKKINAIQKSIDPNLTLKLDTLLKQVDRLNEKMDFFQRRWNLIHGIQENNWKGMKNDKDEKLDSWKLTELSKLAAPLVVLQPPPPPPPDIQLLRENEFPPKPKSAYRYELLKQELYLGDKMKHEPQAWVIDSYFIARAFIWWMRIRDFRNPTIFQYILLDRKTKKTKTWVTV